MCKKWAWARTALCAAAGMLWLSAANGFAAAEDQAAAVPSATAKAPDQPLGELRISGQYVRRLVLTRWGPSVTTASGQAAETNAAAAAQAAFARRYGLRPRAVAQGQSRSLTLTLDSPGPVSKVPLGGYSYQFSLSQGGAVAEPLARYVAPSRYVVVTATNAATLAIGGPLTNSVTVVRRGRFLALDYKLLGVNGEAYQMAGVRKEPEFAIYRSGKDGDTLLASGRFRFG